MIKPKLEQVPLQDLTLPNPVLRDLMQAALARDLPFRFRALGTSMHPFIREGDLVFIHSLHGRRPVIGQVVAFLHPGNGLLLIHRVVRRLGSDYLLQGDNLPGQNDGRVLGNDILGAVTGVQRNGIEVWFGQGLGGACIAWLSRTGMLHGITSLLRGLFRRRGRPVE